MADAVREFERQLPGWWWSVSYKGISRDASCGPCRNGVDSTLLDSKDDSFQRGFYHQDLNGTVASSLRMVTKMAVEARRVGYNKAIGFRKWLAMVEGEMASNVVPMAWKAYFKAGLSPAEAVMQSRTDDGIVG